MDDPADMPPDATGFDMRGVVMSHHEGRCSFETAPLQFDLVADPALEEIGHVVHEADLGDEIFDAPIAAGLDAIIRGLSLTSDTNHYALAVSDRLFDGLYEHIRRHLLSGRPPA